MKIFNTIGSRPQFIQAAMATRSLRKISGVTEATIHTGQHYDRNMSGIFFNELSIPKPTYNPGIEGGAWNLR